MTRTVPPLVLTSRAAIGEHVGQLRAEQKSIGLVPTMGALHAGHISLVEASNQQCDATIVTIFVNPTQFDRPADLLRYPRTLDADLAALAPLSVSALFAPSVEEMVPSGASTFVDPPQVAQPLEGRCRPGHFRGVATIVLKLFHLIPADVAFFGAKDYQQSLVIRRMAEDLDLSIRVCTCPTVREADGLALSSRNAHLSTAERARAISLWQSLERAAALVAEGERDTGKITTAMRQTLVDAGVDSIDYVALTDPESLEELDQLTGPAQALVAATVGTTRLIDNLRVESPGSRVQS